MKSNTLFIKLLGLILFFQMNVVEVSAQACSGQIHLWTQAQVDSFPINYPGCHQINGTLIINGYAITSLDSLSQINSIDGNLFLEYCHSLKDLKGLDNLTSVQGNIWIKWNDSLNSLEGLGNLTEVDDWLDINGNKRLKNLKGLNSLVKVGNVFRVQDCNALDSLVGIETLDSINGFTWIRNNDALKSMVGFENVVIKEIMISENDQLIDLKGLENQVTVQVGISINKNVSLTSLNGLHKFKTINGHLNINSNFTLQDLNALLGLKSVGSLTVARNWLLQDLSGLDSLKWAGSLYIGNNRNLTSFDGLERLDSVKSLGIYGNDTLSDISALFNLKRVEEGNLSILENKKLEVLDGLDNLSYVHETLLIHGNTILKDLKVLSNLKKVGYALIVRDCDSLSSLKGLDSIDVSSMLNLTIFGNPKLSICGVQSVCNYIQSGKDMTIAENALGCEDSTQVAIACQSISIKDEYLQANFQFYPNPTHAEIYLNFSQSSMDYPLNIQLRDELGRVVKGFNSVYEREMKINVNKYGAGLYLLSVIDAHGKRATQKLVIQ